MSTGFLLHLSSKKLQNVFIFRKVAFIIQAHIFKKISNGFAKDMFVALKVLFQRKKKDFHVVISYLIIIKCSDMHLVIPIMYAA